MADLGYHVVNWNVDTKDYLHKTPETIHESEETFAAAVAADGAGAYIVLSHDVHKTTAHVLTEFMLETLGERGYRAVTVGECLGDPEENWYASA
ncbi:hypothetical protein P8C59_002773 [Phyllachora maydis]|nr:hypothetical protein P8C59_002773 [Phyllachora maydis]